MAQEKEIKYLPGQRCDGYIHDASNPGDKYREEWIHKDVVKMTGDKEDDFIINQKPVLLNKVDIQKEIDANAKKVPSIKELVAQVMDTGDESILVRAQGSYGDVSDMPKDLHEAVKIVRDAKEKGINLGDDKLMKMSKEDINKYIDELVQKRIDSLSAKKQPQESVKEGE